MSSIVKTKEDPKPWRPVTLGIGSSLSISKRRKCLTATPSKSPANRKTVVYPKSATATPRTSKLIAVEEKPRSKSVTSFQSSVSWRLPAYMAHQHDEVTKEKVITKKTTPSVPVFPAAALNKSVVAFQECDSALRVLPLKREGKPSYVPQRTSDLDSQMKEFIDIWSGMSSAYHKNSFKSSQLKRYMQGAPGTDNRYLAYVEELMRRRYHKMVNSQLSAQQDDAGTDSSDDSASEPLPHTNVPLSQHLFPKLVVTDVSVANPQPTTTASSSTAHNGAFSGGEIVNSRGDNARKSSSETRTSSSPDDNTNIKDRNKMHRPSSRGKRRAPHTNGLIALERVSRDLDMELPSVLDENITGTRLSLPAQRIKPQAKPTSRPVTLKPLSSNDQISNCVNNTNQLSHLSQKQIKPLTISGLSKPDIPASGEEDAAGLDWAQTSQTKTPLISSHSQQNNNNNSSNSTSSNNNNLSTVTSFHKTDSNNTLSTLAVTAASMGSNSNPRRSLKSNNIGQSSLGNTKQVGGSRRKSPEDESKYADPIVGASSLFQSRLSELASLEAETVRYERLRKLKKRNKEKDD